MLKLEQIVDAIEMIFDEELVFLDKTTNEIVRVESDIHRIAEEYEEGDELQLAEWQRDSLKNALRVFENGDCFLRLPSKYDINEYNIMEEFCQEYPNERISDRLCSLIRGSGAFRRFKEAISGYDIEEQWYTHKQQSYVNIARNWCEDNKLEFEE
ncbi:MAG: UPF0158 family protein [Bacillota bacterium]